MDIRKKTVPGRRDVIGTLLRGGAAAALLGSEGSSLFAQGEAGKKGTGKVRHLGQPCRARNVHVGTLVYDAGREWFVITNTNENAHVELIFIDAVKDVGEVYRAPAGAGAWALQKLPGNRLAIGTYYNGTFLIFDVPTRKWVNQIKFPGEDYIWQAALGKDGRLYGGTYPGGKLGAINVDTGAFEDLGAPAPPNKYLRWTTALPDGRIHCNMQFDKPQSVIFDPATKHFTPAPPEMDVVTKGVVWNGYYLWANKAFRMPDLALVDPLPFPTPDPKNGEWAVDPYLTTTDLLVLRQGVQFYELRTGDKTLIPTYHLRARGGGSLFARNTQGDVFGIRGQDYFVMTPTRKERELHRIPGEAAPRGTQFLSADDRGRLWGGPTFGQTLFYMDVPSAKTVNTGVVSDYGGEVYDVEVVDGVCYAVAYAGGELIRFEPEKPWKQAEGMNPKTVARVGPDYIRPEAGLSRLPGGTTLYSGWLAAYGKFGGLLHLYDIKTGKAEQVVDPLGPHGLSGVLPLSGGAWVALGTTTAGNGLGQQGGVPARFGVWDMQAKKLIYSRDFSDTTSLHSFVYEEKSGLVAFMAAGGKLYLFDPQRQAFVHGDAPAKTGLTCRNIVVPSGRVLYGTNETLYAYNTDKKDVTSIATLPGKIENIAVEPAGKTAFVSCGVDVYAVSL